MEFYKNFEYPFNNKRTHWSHQTTQFRLMLYAKLRGYSVIFLHKPVILFLIGITLGEGALGSSEEGATVLPTSH